MTFAEIVLVAAGLVGIYVLLRPLQRWLEHYLVRKVLTRHPRARLPTIDVTDLASQRSRQKAADDNDDDS
jgi:hypothetical protein